MILCVKLLNCTIFPIAFSGENGMNVRNSWIIEYAKFTYHHCHDQNYNLSRDANDKQNSVL
jgi:hypothetical protein